jgi:phosphatidylserine/phosphatidylglycerophosphate/cardiolipin synthase-like enzyme
VYVHAKVCVVDDAWCTIGSGNLNLRSWTFDTELSCAVVAQDRTGTSVAQQLRLALVREHLDRTDGDDLDLRDPADAFNAVAQSAKELDAWHEAGGRGARPPARLRPYRDPALSRVTVRWASPLYRTLYDPDGRPAPLRRRHAF